MSLRDMVPEESKHFDCLTIVRGCVCARVFWLCVWSLSLSLLSLSLPVYLSFALFFLRSLSSLSLSLSLSLVSLSRVSFLAGPVVSGRAGLMESLMPWLEQLVPSCETIAPAMEVGSLCY